MGMVNPAPAAHREFPMGARNRAGSSSFLLKGEASTSASSLPPGLNV